MLWVDSVVSTVETPQWETPVSYTITHSSITEPVSVQVQPFAVCSGRGHRRLVAGFPVQLCCSPDLVWPDPPPAGRQSTTAAYKGTVWSRWWRRIVRDTWRSRCRTAPGNTSASDRLCRSLSSLCRPAWSGQTGTSVRNSNKTVCEEASPARERRSRQFYTFRIYPEWWIEKYNIKWINTADGSFTKANKIKSKVQTAVMLIGQYWEF